MCKVRETERVKEGDRERKKRGYIDRQTYQQQKKLLIGQQIAWDILWLDTYGPFFDNCTSYY